MYKWWIFPHLRDILQEGTCVIVLDINCVTTIFVMIPLLLG